ncbi:MAG: DinB family protein [Planctomycetota bacterium]|nr:MAG: DinB family protein [Planctomycetota bacterium]
MWATSADDASRFGDLERNCMSKAILEGCLVGLEFSRSALLRLAEDIPAESRTHQPVPGANHLMWVLGHLATTDDYFLSKLSGRPQKFDEEWLAKFWMGSTPRADVADYPPYQQLVDIAKERRAALTDYLRSLSDEQLAAAMPEGIASFAPSVAALPACLAAHEGLHSGQLTVQRKSLGIPPAMG